MPTKLILSALIAASSLGVAAQPVAEMLDGTDSVYSGKLVQVLQRWPGRHVHAPGGGPVELTCLATAEQEKYVGMLQRTTIRAPISAVEAVLDDVAHYQDLFPDLVGVTVVPGSQRGNRYMTSWVQRIPLFFIPNVTYELAYVLDRTMPGRSVYRYKLGRADQLIASDGMVVLEAIGPGTTQFTEYDFFHARPVPIPTHIVWRESLRSAFLSDIAIKLKAENPGWSYKRIASEGERLVALESERIERCFAERQNVGPSDAL
jgi:hypothetical protein